MHHTLGSSSRRWDTLARLGGVALVAVLGACGSRASSPDAAGTDAQAATASRGDDDDATTRARVERGLAISPVPIDTAGLSAHQRKLVGLGSYIVNAASSCAGCHSSAAGFLAGGNPFFLGDPSHVVWSRNLTPDAATGMKLTLDEFVETIRTGRDFHPGADRMLLVMPWPYFRWSSTLDLEAIYAYLHAIPPVANTVPPDAKSDIPVPASLPFPDRTYTDGDVTRRLGGDHRSFDVRRGLAISPEAQPAGLDHEALEAFGVGSYISNALTACSECHTNPERKPNGRIDTGAWLTGGTVFGVPPPRQSVLHQVRSMSGNLKGASHGFFSKPDDSFDRFAAIIRTGTHADEPSGRPLGFPMILIAGYLSHLLDEDLRAVYAYVKTMPSTAGATDVERQPYARWCAAASDCMAGETCAAATHECVGGACTSDVDCGACQTCSAGACAAPAPTDACVTSAR